jgi:ATP/maltotriose-dependent transcriptional regulator MalT
MLNPSFLHSFFRIFAFLVLVQVSFAQEFADKEYYLVDSLVLEDFSEKDRALIEECIEGYHAYDDDTIKMRALFYLSSEMDNREWVKYNALQYKMATDKLKEDLAPDIEHFYYRILAQVINDQGILLDKEGESQKAIKKYKESVQVSFKISDQLGISTGLNNLGSSYRDMGDLKTAVAYFKQSLLLRRKLKMPDRIANSYSSLAGAYNASGDVKSALSYYFKSLHLYDSLDWNRKIATTQNNIGTIYSSQKNFEKAMAYHKKALKIRTEIDHRFGIANSLSNLGHVYQQRGELNTSKSYYERSLIIYEKINDAQGIIQVKRAMGDVCIALKLYSRAELLLKEANTAAKESSYAEELINSENSLSKLYLETGDTLLAFKSVQNSLKLSQTYNYLKLERNAQLQLSECFKRSGDYEKGWNAYSVYVLLKDSLENSQIQLQAAIEEADYYALNDVKKIPIKKELATKRQNSSYFYVILISALVIITLSAFAVTIRRQKKKINGINIETPASQSKQFQSDEHSNPTPSIGEKSFEPNLKDINRYLSEPLTQSELKVLEELVKGSANKEIASTLFISINTVKSHLMKIYHKLGVNNRTQATQKVNELERRALKDQ